LHELRVLFYNSLYPDRTGSFHRAFNIAKIASGAFDKTTMYALHEKTEYRGISDGIHLVQEKKYSGSIDKYRFYLQSLLSNKYSLRCPSEALQNLDSESVLQVEGPYYYHLLKASGVEKYVLDEANVYWELLDFPTFDLKNRVYNRMASARNRTIEIAAVKDASHVLACSNTDKGKLIDAVPGMEDKIAVIPNCVDFDEYSNYLAVNRERDPDTSVKKVLFVGAFNYSPNIDAAHLICEKIAPAFGPEVGFIIAGRNPPRIRKPDNVEFTGLVEDLKTLTFNCDVCIAPIRYGSGTRFKILEYMAMGKPVVSTSKGAEGIDYTDGTDIFIEDDFGRFNERIRELLRNPGRFGQSAQQLIVRKYDWKLYKGELQRIYREVSNN
jgi:glycosyltransferase involved in cell wall biosynthesis